MQQVNILVVENPVFKSAQERMSGILRYSATKPNWAVRTINPHIHDPAMLKRLTADPARIDGIIGYSRTLAARGFCSLSQLRGIPTVAMEVPRGVSPCPRKDLILAVDNAAIAQAAADRFAQGSLRHFAYVGNDPLRTDVKFDTMHSRRREAAFRRAAKAIGATCATYRTRATDDWTDDLNHLAQWISRLPFPVGIFAFNDQRAQKVVDACNLAHVTVPDQVRLIGVDNDVSICENLQPTLTSIQIGFKEGGYLAAQALDEILANGHMGGARRKISCGVMRLVERASTQDLKGGGRTVALAREYMRNHASERITLTDVARQLNLSVRTLSLRFREVLHTSPAKILRQYRLEFVRERVARREGLVGEIASTSGFASESHLKKLFKRTYGQTMGKYRFQGFAAAANRPDGAHHTP